MPEETNNPIDTVGSERDFIYADVPEAPTVCPEGRAMNPNGETQWDPGTTVSAAQRAIQPGPIRPPLRLVSGLTSCRTAESGVQRPPAESQPDAANNRPSVAWKRVEEAIDAHHYKPDLEAARAVYAAIAAHSLPGFPAWMMHVAPPGTMKTELLEALEGLRGVFVIDQVTSSTFISGQIKDPGKPTKTSASLLHRIGEDARILCPDFSTVLSMKRDSRPSVLADMRRIYDGHLHKEYGTSDGLGERDWRGRITFSVCATPEVDRHYSIFQTLGERFLMVRSPRAEGEEAALSAMNQDNADAKKALKQAVHGLFNGLPVVEPEVPSEIQRKIAALTEVAVHGRTHVPRSGNAKEIVFYVPQAESPTRLAQQLVQLAKGSARLDRRRVVNEKDLGLVRRVAFDCIPSIRRAILDALISGELPDPSKLKIPPTTFHYAVQDLELQGLIQTEKHGNRELHRLSTLAEDLLRRAGVARYDNSPGPT